MANRDPSGRWLPGVTGNGGGRPKTDPEVRQALEAGSLAAAERLVALTGSDDERVALAASIAVLDRVLGKPAQAVTVTQDEPDWGEFLPTFQAAVLANLRAVHDRDDDDE